MLWRESWALERSLAMGRAGLFARAAWEVRIDSESFGRITTRQEQQVIHPGEGQAAATESVNQKQKNPRENLYTR